MSIRTKILTIVMGFFSLIAIAFAFYSFSVTANYKQLRTDEVSKTVAYEGERVQKIISEMERNAIDLALAGEQFYRTGKYSSELGAAISIDNFKAFRSAVGGGIWFEPYIIDSAKKRVCYYAFFDTAINDTRLDLDFESEAYDYHTQIWYTQISERLNEKYGTAWTVPYYDDAGTNSLMTTVGAGIHDASGKLIGMSTVDWQIQSMIDRLSAIKPTKNSFALIVSSKDNFVISNTYKKADSSTTSLKDLAWDIEADTFELDGVKYIVFRYIMENGWLFSVQIPVDEIFAEIENQNKLLLIISIIFAIVMLCCAFFFISKLVNLPLKRLTSSVAELGDGNLDNKIEIHSKDEIGMLAETFNKMTVDLKASIEQNVRANAEKERISTELNVATQIQANMLPSIFPAFPHRNEFEIYATMQPAKEVGGDFYDFFLIDKDTLVLVMADVSGKGVPAALFMVIAKTLIKNNAQNGKTPKEVFETVNNILCENNETGMFVTAFMGYLNIPSGKFTFVNAGHNLPFLKTDSEYKFIEAKNRRLVLAAMENIIYKEETVTLKNGDELFLYTDGVTEAMNSDKELFGDKRLAEVLNNNTNLPLENFTKAIKDEIDKFADGAEQADDITMLTLKFLNPETSSEKTTKELFVEARVENLDIVLDFIKENLNALNCPQKVQTQFFISAEEVFVNIANYAYTPGTGSAAIRISGNEEITIEFEDSGKPYNPLEKEDPDITLSVEERPIGGLGIFMVKKIMDSLEYNREGDKNILKLKKKL